MRTAPLLSTAALVLAACASSVSTQGEVKPGASFAGLHTFAWQPTELTKDASPELRSAVAMIQEMTTSELRARGYAPAEGGTPDFRVAGWVSVASKESVAYVDNGFSGFGDSGGSAAPATAVRSTYEEGTLVLDVVNGATGAPMWRGTAVGTVDRSLTPEARRARLQQAVRDTVAKLPKE